MAFGDFKYLTRRTTSDKILHDKAFNIAKNPKYNGYQRSTFAIFDIFFDTKTYTCANKFSGSGSKNENISNKELPEELHKPVIRNFRKRIYNQLL